MPAFPIITARVTKEVWNALRSSAKDHKQPATARAGDILARHFCLEPAKHPKVGRPRTRKGRSNG